MQQLSPSIVSFGYQKSDIDRDRLFHDRPRRHTNRTRDSRPQHRRRNTP